MTIDITNSDRSISNSSQVNRDISIAKIQRLLNNLFINSTYFNILDRDYDQDDYNYWLGNLKNGTETRYKLLLGFQEELLEITS